LPGGRCRMYRDRELYPAWALVFAVRFAPMD